MKNLGIGQKVIINVVIILVLYTIGLTSVVIATNLDNLTKVKQAELDRMSQILAGRIKEMEHNAVLTARSFEESKPIVSEINLIANFGPYYSDPSSYVAANFKDRGALIENSAKIYTFQSQLNLIQQLRPVQRLNNFSTISFYLLPPFDLVSGAKPALALQLDQNGVFISQFIRKGGSGEANFYHIPWEQFRPPAPDYFDISSAYSASPDQYYRENNFIITGTVSSQFFYGVWRQINEPRSQIIVENDIPIIQTWYPVKTPILHPETWAEETTPVGVVVIEQILGADVLATLKDQLGNPKTPLESSDGGLDVGLAREGNLLENTLGTSFPVSLAGNDIITFAQDDFYYARQGIEFFDKTSANLEAVVLSPASELEQLNQTLARPIGQASLVAIIVIGLVVYIGIQYVVSRPLGRLIRGADLITAGDLSQSVPVQSRDELGQLAGAFNGMANQLRKLIGSLEQQVADRTQGLEIVNNLSERLNSILDFDQLLDELVNQVKEQFGYYHAQVYLLKTQNLVMTAGAGEIGAQMKAQGHQIPLDAPTSLVARAARTGEIAKVDNVREATDWLPNALLPDTYSEMAVPIFLDEQVVGVLDVQQNKLAGLDEGDIHVMRLLANQVAVAIRNARLFKQVETALAEAHAAQDRYLEQSWQKTKVISQHGQYLYAHPQAAPLDEPKREALTRVRKRFLSPEQPVIVPLSEDDSLQKTLVAPIHLRNKIIGSVQLCASSPGQPWSKEDLAIIETVLDQVAQAAENLRLFEETRERAGREQSIREITDKLRTAPNLEVLLETAARELGQRLGVRHTVLELGLETTLPGQGK